MSFQDITFVWQWWAAIFIIGIAFLPLTTKLFFTFLDKGYIFSKIIGIILVSYTVFLLSTLHILSFSSVNSIAVLLGFAICVYLFLLPKNIINYLRSLPKISLIEEAFFLGGILFWSWIRTFQPDIHGLEKYMDYGFVNSILRTNFFPPKDMWYAPLTINYYYFGHLATAVLTRISFLPSSITFNLMLATIFAFCFTAAFSIGINLLHTLVKQVKNTKYQIPYIYIGGLLSAFLLSFGGNLHTIYLFFKPYQNDYPVPIWRLPFSPLTFPNSYWYPNATRFIYHTIHEFPIYSFVVSDLHGHVLDIPFVLLTIAFIFVLFIKPVENPKKELLNSAILGFLLSIMYMTNAWDGLIYLVCGFFVFFLRTINFSFKNVSKKLLKNYFVLHIAVILIGFLFFSLPFSFFFHPGDLVGGIGINCTPQFLINVGRLGPFLFEQGYCQHSPWWQLATLYGFFYFWAISLIIFLIKNKSKQILITDFFALFLIFISTLLIIMPEFVYMKDIYTTYFRANTMFKLVYQAFIMLSLVSGYTVIRLLLAFKINFPKLSLGKKVLSICYVLISICLLTLVSTYPYFAVNSYYNNLSAPQTLNGTAYLAKLYPTDYQAILWLNRNVFGQAVILEANGDSYTDYARISSSTGLPTVIGWPVHEWLWRGSYAVAAPRIADVQTLYETTSLATTQKLIKIYNIGYVFVGDLEKQKYTNLDEGKFEKLGKVVFKDGSTIIYKVN